MGFLYRNFKRALRLYFSFKTINLSQFFKYNRSDSDVVMIMRPEIKSIWEGSFEMDLVLIGALTKAAVPFSIYRGKNYGQFRNKIIVSNHSYLFNNYGFSNYSESQFHIFKQWEEQDNKTIPPADEIRLWENKVYMYSRFKELGVLHPETFIFPSVSDFLDANLSYPLLIKEAHSHASKGLYKVNNEKEALELFNSNSFKSGNKYIIAQKLMNMRKDLRVTVIGKEIVLHYWRTNPDKEWKPTATSHGSNVDFVTFPEKWRSYFLDLMDKLQINTGGFDFAWENDDLETMPYCLEVSPIYQPNPIADMTGKPYTYGQWKKKLLIKDSWDEAYTNCYFDMRYKYVSLMLKKYGKIKE